MRKIGKKIAALFLVGVLILTLGGCGAKDDAEKAFHTMMQALQTGEKEQVQSYYDFETATSEVQADNKAELEDAILGTLQQMQYEVTSVEKLDSTNVVIKAHVTTVDFSQVMTRFVEQLTTLVAEKEYQAQLSTLTRAEYQGLLAERMIAALKQGDGSTTSSTIEVRMVKESGAWKMQPGQDDFLNSIFANLANAIASLA